MNKNIATYPHKEKLKSRKTITQVFEQGKTFAIYPIRFFYLDCSEETSFPNLQTGVIVRKKNFKHAVERNRIKRLLRESYRLEKNSLATFLTDSNKKVALFLLYTGKDLPTIELLKEKTAIGLQKIMERINETSA